MQIKNGIRGQVDWPNVQGDGWTARFQITRLRGTPANWTGYTFEGQIRKYSSPTSPLVADIEFDLTEGDGWVTMYVPAEARSGIKAGEYFYAVRWTPPDSEPRTLFGGRFPVASSVVVSNVE